MSPEEANSCKHTHTQTTWWRQELICEPAHSFAAIIAPSAPSFIHDALPSDSRRSAGQKSNRSGHKSCVSSTLNGEHASVWNCEHPPRVQTTVMQPNCIRIAPTRLVFQSFKGRVCKFCCCSPDLFNETTHSGIMGVVQFIANPYSFQLSCSITYKCGTHVIKYRRFGWVTSLA